MSQSGAFHLSTGFHGSTGLQGKQIDKDQLESTVEQYAKYHDLHGGDEEFRKSNYSDLVNKYYDLVTSFTEYHWGQSFHFAQRWRGETIRESIKRFEHFIALQLGLKKGMMVRRKNRTALLIYSLLEIFMTLGATQISNNGPGCRMWNWGTLKRNRQIQLNRDNWVEQQCLPDIKGQGAHFFGRFE